MGRGIWFNDVEMNAKSFTKRQREELRERCDVRMDTVSSDPESGDEFENTPGSLEILRGKLMEGVNPDFTAEEIEWLRGESENLASIADANHSFPEWDGQRKSMSNLAGKF